jgi:signal transduction histidine kinase
MKVTVKLVVAFMLGTFVVTAIGAWLEISVESREFRQRVDAEVRGIGQLLEDAVNLAWQSQGQEGVVQLLLRQRPAAHDLRVSWVWFDASSGPYRPKAELDQVQNVLFERTPSVIIRDVESHYLCDYWPIQLPVERAGGLQFLKPMEELEEEKRDVIVEAVTFSATTALFSGVLMAVFGARFLGRPLEEIIEQTKRIAAGDLDARVELKSNDELEHLAESFNTMCSELQASQALAQQESAGRLEVVEQLRHEDRLKTVGRLASGVAHELGTPLNVVAGRAELIASGELAPEEVVSSAKTIQQEAGRMTTIIRHLLDFARRRTPERSSVDVRALVDETSRLLEPMARKRNVTIDVALGDAPCTAEVDPGQIKQVISNLIVNAIQSMPEGGQVHVDVARRQSTRSSAREEPPESFICIRVRDEGEGISAEDLPYVFEPFFTTKSIGEGTGLGLSISYGIVKEHGGFVDVESQLGRGSSFVVFLPLGMSR